MRNTFLLISVALALSCNTSAGNSNQADSTISPVKTTIPTACLQTIFFKKGSTMSSRTTDATNKVLSVQQSTVERVYSQDGMTVSEIKTVSTETSGPTPKVMQGVYRCDGTNMMMDLSSFIENKPGMSINSTGVPFPLDIKAGSVLPESKYTLTVTTGGKQMKIHATIKDRRVETREQVKVAAGTFSCYRIHATIEAITEMDGMTPEMQAAMEKARGAMPKNTMIIWFDPVVTVVKMEMYMGSNLLTRTELTNVSK